MSSQQARQQGSLNRGRWYGLYQTTRVMEPLSLSSSGFLIARRIHRHLPCWRHHLFLTVVRVQFFEGNMDDDMPRVVTHGEQINYMIIQRSTFKTLIFICQRRLLSA
jgi:hypothetical protein